MSKKEENVARALSAAPRRQILRLLCKKPLKVKEVAELTGMSVSLASRHLKLLYDLNILDIRKEYPFKFYFVKVKHLNELLIAYDKVVGGL